MSGETDLAVAFGAAFSARTFGTTTDVNLYVPIVVSNLGQAAADDATVNVAIYARPADDPSGNSDVLLSLQSDCRVSSLLNPYSQLCRITIASLPEGLANGTYSLVAVVDSSNAMAEPDEANNVAVYENALTLADPYGDMAISIDSTTPPTFVTDDSGVTSVVLDVSLKNVGNLPTQIESIDLYARTGDGAGGTTDTLISSSLSPSGLSVGSLLISENSTLNWIGVAVPLPTDLPAGEYTFVAVVRTPEGFVDQNLSNNTAVSAAATLGETGLGESDLGVSNPMPDLVIDVVSSSLPATVVAGQSFNCTVLVSNVGMEAVASDITTDVVLYARISDGQGGTTDTLLQEMPRYSIGGLQVGASRSFSVPVTVPATLAAGQYTIVAVVDKYNLVAESDDTNNTGVSTSQVQVIELQQDLSIAITSELTLPASAVSGSDQSFTLPLAITNTGNAAFTGSASISFQAFMLDSESGAYATESFSQFTLTLSGLAVGQTQTCTASLTLPAEMPEGNYIIVANLSAAAGSNLVEASTFTQGQIAVTAGCTDFAVVSASGVVLLADDDSNHSDVTIVVSNLGNLSTTQEGLSRLVLRLEGESDILASQDVALQDLAPGESLTFHIDCPLTITQIESPGLPTIRIVPTIIVSLEDAPADYNEDNNLLLADITESPYVDLAPTIDSSVLPAIAISGGDPVPLPITITNRGNTAVAAGTTIDIAIYARTSNGQGGTTDTLLKTLTGQSVGSLAASATKTFTAEVTLPASLAAGSYTLVAVVDSANAVAEGSETNNTALSAAIDVVQGYVDLTAAVSSASLPASAISGDSAVFTMPVTVKNTGNIAVAAGTTIYISYYARMSDGQGGYTDTLLKTISGQSVGSLEPGGERTFTTDLTLPVTLATGQYTLLAVVDSTNVVAESDETNNSALPSAAIDVTKGYYDLTVTLDMSSLPASIVRGNTKALSLSMTVKNEGNIPLAVGQSTMILISLCDSVYGGSAKNILSTQNVSSLASGATKTFSITLSLSSLATGNYNIIAVVDSSNKIAESNEANNTVLSDTAIAVVESYVDLTATVSSAYLPATVMSGTSTALTLPVTVKNEGNAAIAANTDINIAFYARTSDGAGGTTDTFISAITGQTIGGLAPNAVKTFNIGITLPASLAAGSYTLVAVVDSANAVAESDENNNTAVSNTINVTAPYVDLTATVSSASLPAATISGAGTTFTLPITVKNEGNIAIATGTMISIDLYARISNGAGGFTDTLLKTITGQSVGALVANASKTFTTTFTLPASLATGSYTIVAVVDSANAIAESDETNNTAVSNAIDVTQLHLALSAKLGTTGYTLPATVIDVQRFAGRVLVVLTNSGNLAMPRTQKVNVTVVAHSLADDTEIVLGQYFNYSIGGLKAGATRQLYVSASATALPAGEYEIRALVTAVATGDKPFDGATAAVTVAGQPRTLTSVASYVDLSAAIGKTALPAAVISGSGKVLSLPVAVKNEGNVAIAAGTTIDIAIYARVSDGQGGFTDTLLKTIANQSVSKLAANATRTFKTTVTLPAGLETGDYTLVAVVDSSNKIAESDETDNSAVTAASIAVTRGYVDLTGAFGAKSALPSTLQEGQRFAARLPITIQNTGNIKLAVGQTVALNVYAHDEETGVDILLLDTDLSVSALLGSRVLSPVLSKADGLPSGNYTLRATLSLNSLADEEDLTNNLIVLDTLGNAKSLTVV